MRTDRAALLLATTLAACAGDGGRHTLAVDQEVALGCGGGHGGSVVGHLRRGRS